MIGATSLIKDRIWTMVFVIIPRFDNLNNKVSQANNCLMAMCGDRDIPLLSHSESVTSSKHVNFNGVKVFVENFSVFLTNFD